MVTYRLTAVIQAALIALALVSTASAFKAQDFKTCSRNSFCERNRGKRLGNNFEVDPSSANLGSDGFSAIFADPSTGGKRLKLNVNSYTDGFFRIFIDEYSYNERYQVPRDIITSEWESRKAPLVDFVKNGTSSSFRSGESSVVINFKPFTLAVYVKDQPAVLLNSKDLFNFEIRQKHRKGDAEAPGLWEESFGGHADQKRSGPESISLDLYFPGFEHVYGIPEHAGPLSLPDTGRQGTLYADPYRLYNLDVFQYDEDSAFGLYGAIPFMWAHKRGLTTGVFWLNAAEMYVDVSRADGRGVSTQWIAEAGVVDLFVFTGGSPAAVSTAYAAITGTTSLPPLFALGYHQCRWNYRDEEDVRQVDRGFDEHAIPYDVLWLDIEHTQGRRYLTWHKTLFPSPVEMQNDLRSRGRRMVTIVDPHVARDEQYYIFKQARLAGHYVRNRDGNDFDGHCWPGASSYLDVTSPVVRNWWAEQFSTTKYEGSTTSLFIWNDMNEPSVFSGPEITMPKDNLHYAKVEHRQLHNLYGIYYHMATAEGLIRRGDREGAPGRALADGARPFVLSRAFFAGTQRAGPIWTGDNGATWGHLRASPPMLLSLNLAGLPFVGADVGGFFGNPNPELLVRWYQVGAFYPFFRGHAHIDSERREPWLFGQQTTEQIRTAIRSRYALLPYLYTLFRRTNETGLPILEPVWFEFPEEEDAFDSDDRFLLGPAVFVQPVLHPLTTGGGVLPLRLPRGAVWYSASSGDRIDQATKDDAIQVTMNTVPVFYRGGHVVPRRERARRSTVAAARDPYTLVVALDEQARAAGELYADDGETFAFHRRGEFLHRLFVFENMTLSSSPKPAAAAVPDVQPEKKSSWVSVLAGGGKESPRTPLADPDFNSISAPVDRIAFLGLPKLPSSGSRRSAYVASFRIPGTEEVTEVPLEAEILDPAAESLQFVRPKTGPSEVGVEPALVLRLAHLGIKDDWEITISAKEQGTDSLSR